MYRVILALFVTVVAVRTATTEARAVEVYLFRGAGDFSFIAENAHFSRGLERLADRLNDEGIHAEVRRYSGTADALRTIRRRRPDSVAIVGHSMGALAALRLARKLRDEGTRVAYLATLDIPGPVGRAGSNVEWAENYYSMTPTFALLTNTRSHPNARNIHVFALHQAIDDSDEVRGGILAAIRHIHAAEQAVIATPFDEPMSIVPFAAPPRTGLEISPEIDTTPLW